MDIRKYLVPTIGLEQAAGMKTSDFKAEQLAAVLHNDYKPHRLAKDARGRLFEFISYPYAEGGKVLVKARVPGDPMSMETKSVFELTPEGTDCYCAVAGRDYYLQPDYYRQREAERLAENTTECKDCGIRVTGTNPKEHLGGCIQREN